MKAELKTLSGSVTAKVLFIALLILILLIPLGMIEGVILERSHLYATAREGVGQSWGQAQAIGGPIVVVPFTYTRLVNGHAVTVNDELYALPEQLEVTGDVETRRTATRDLQNPRLHGAPQRRRSFRSRRACQRVEDLAIHWEQAAIALPITDARSVREPIVLASGDGTTVFEAGGARVAGFGPLLVAPYAALGLGAAHGAAGLFLSSSCSTARAALEFLPLGDETRVGAHLGLAFAELRRRLLPERARACTTTGSRPSGACSSLGRGFPSRWGRSEGPSPRPSRLRRSACELITPVGIHEAALRAAKYGVLIVGFTFVAYFLFELFAPLRLHALQYLLIGLANCVFYLLLLALAEHIGFGPAYVASAVAVDGADHELQRRRAALVAPRRADRRLADGAVRLSLRHAEGRGLRAAVRRARRVRGARSLHVSDAAHRLVRRDVRRQDRRAARACSCTRERCRAGAVRRPRFGSKS